MRAIGPSPHGTYETSSIPSIHRAQWERAAGLPLYGTRERRRRRLTERRGLLWPPERSRASVNFIDAVASEERLHRQLDRLAARAKGSRLDTLAQAGVRLATLLDERDKVVRLLAASLRDGSYRPGPARIGVARIGNQERALAKVGALDWLAHSAVGTALAERLESHLSEHLYSYRSGRSAWQAVRWLSGLARRHRASEPDVRARGLYVLRADVSRYTDSIPLEDGDPVWSDLATYTGLDEGGPHFEMLRWLLRPVVVDDAGVLGGDKRARRARGLCFGLPTTNVIGNLYLMPLDEALGGALGGAYARFGDDVLFADREPERVRCALARLYEVLEPRALTVHRDKLRVVYWNGAARPSTEWPETTASETVSFLGSAVRFDGTIALTTAKWRALLRDVRARIRRTAKLFAADEPDVRAAALSAVVNAAFDAGSEIGVPHALHVANLVSSRAQLAQLDYLLALWIAEGATGRRGPRAFRIVSYARLREEFALASRVVHRNAPSRPPRRLPSLR